MNLRPTGNRVLVRPTPPPQQTAGGVVVPVAWQQPSGRGMVVAAGDRVTEIKPGDKVLYSWIDGMDVEHLGNTCRLLDVGQIIGVIE